MNKNLTIIIPTYNDTLEKIRRSLKSIAKQKYYDLSRTETIIVDDCSDNNKIFWDELIKEYKCLNIKYKKLSKNKGPGVARQFALDISSGNFVFFLDCGDSLFDEYVLKVFKEYNNLNLDIIATDIRDEHSGRRIRGFSGATVQGIFVKKQFLEINNIRFNKVLRWEEDTYFERLLKHYAPNIIFTNTVGYLYSDDPDSITRKNNCEYKNKFVGLSAMIIKSLLLCDFYESLKDYKNLMEELVYPLTICYARFYKSLFKENKVSKRQENILYLLKIFLNKFTNKLGGFDAIRSFFIKDISRRNATHEFMLLPECKEMSTLPCNKIDEFIVLVRNFKNLNGDYQIEGTNISIDKLLTGKYANSNK